MDPQPKSDLKLQIFEQFARICKALGSAWRFELLELLAQGEHTVEALARETGMSVANTSQHLKNLRSARLVDASRRRTEMHYRLADETVFQLLQAIQDIAEARLAEVDRIVARLNEDRASMEPVTFEELREILQADSSGTMVIDVRPSSEYLAGHIPGTQSYPLVDLETHYQQFPLDNQVIACCRGYYSFLADQVVNFLQSKGYTARRINQGFAEWKAAGLPVEQGLPIEKTDQ
jgi:rhodanese-related sulfurtransferase/DNA-binding transcriptional ArsR family regulator